MTQRFVLWGLFFWVTAACAPCLSQIDTQSVKEYSLKAAWLTNFIKYQKWPKNWAGDRLVIVVLGQDPFQNAFDPVKGRSFMGKKLEVRHLTTFSTPADVRDCHLLFICQSEKRVQEKIFAALKGRSVIVVGEVDNFAAPGKGDFNFLKAKDQVIYEMNPYNLESKGFAVKSTLLKYARYLITDEGRRITPRKLERRR